jgi:uncharacterized phage protein (TIGR02220 family)
LYVEYGILTSKGIQKRYFRACIDCRRKDIKAQREFLLINDELIELIPTLTEFTSSVSTQKKGNDNRVNEKKEEDTLSSDVPSDLVKDVVAYLNEKTGKAFKPASKKTQLLIKARVKDLSVGLDDFKKVIDVKCEQWLDDPKYSKYLQPTTLFGTKFEGYLNEWVEPKKQERSYKLFGDDPADLEGIDIDNVPF